MRDLYVRKLSDAAHAQFLRTESTRQWTHAELIAALLGLHVGVRRILDESSDDSDSRRLEQVRRLMESLKLTTVVG